MKVTLDFAEHKDGSFVCRLRKIADRYNTAAEKAAADRVFLSIRDSFGDEPDRTVVHDDLAAVDFVYERIPE